MIAKPSSPWGALTKGRGLPGLPGMRRRKSARAVLGALEKLSTEFDLVDDELAEMERAVGDRQRARAMLKIRRTQYPNATLPELVCIEWLQRRSIEYLFQEGLLGGRLYKGGLVPDLVVYQGSSAFVWAVQGNYWHSRPGMEGRDLAAQRMLLGLEVYGHTIAGVVEIWESRLTVDASTHRKPDIDGALNAALTGIELGQ